MTSYQCGDTVLVPYPYSDMNVRKMRPGVVVSNAAYFQATQHVWIVMITRAKGSSWPMDQEIQDCSAAGILPESKIRYKIACFEHGMVKRKLGRLADADLEHLKNTTQLILKHDA